VTSGFYPGDIHTMRPASGRVLEDDNGQINILDQLRGNDTGGEVVRVQLTDSLGRRVMASAAGELITAIRSDDVLVNFHYGQSTFDTRATATGTGVVSQVGAMAAVSTGTGIGSATIRSRAAVRYQARHETYCAPSVVFAPPEDGVDQMAGFSDSSDSFCMGYSGLISGLWFIRGGVPTFVPQTAWNIDTLDGTGQSGYTLNMLGGQVPEFKYIWHGLKNLTLELATDMGVLLPCHRFSFVNSSTDVHLLNPSLPVSVSVTREAGTGANLTLKTGSWRAGVVVGSAGSLTGTRKFDYANIGVAAGANVRHVLLGLRNGATFKGMENHIRAESSWVQAIADGTKPAVFEAWAPSQGVFSVPLEYTPRDPVNSVMLFSKTLATFEPNLDELPNSIIATGKSDQQIVQNDAGEGLFLYPGEEVVVTVLSTGNTSAGFTVRTREYF
jgi:hypothetical protein